MDAPVVGLQQHGIDNNMRASLFGPAGDTTWNRQRLERECRNFVHTELDIRSDEVYTAELTLTGARLVDNSMKVSEGVPLERISD